MSKETINPFGEQTASTKKEKPSSSKKEFFSLSKENEDVVEAIKNMAASSVLADEANSIQSENREIIFQHAKEIIISKKIAESFDLGDDNGNKVSIVPDKKFKMTVKDDEGMEKFNAKYGTTETPKPVLKTKTEYSINSKMLNDEKIGPELRKVISEALAKLVKNNVLTATQANKEVLIPEQGYEFIDEIKKFVLTHEKSEEIINEIGVSLQIKQPTSTGTVIKSLRDNKIWKTLTGLIFGKKEEKKETEVKTN